MGCDARNSKGPKTFGLLAIFYCIVGLATPVAHAAAPLTVLAASSLTESLQRAAAAWTAQGHPTIQFSFDASSRLARQIDAGLPADLYFSADAEWMDEVASHQAILGDTRVNLVGNALVAVVPARSSLALPDAASLAQPGLRHLALAAESVPAGKYARTALNRLGVSSRVQDRVVNGDNVRTVLAWVASGEAEAGIVYATDARVEPRVRVAFAFPPASVPAIVYPAAVLRASTQPAEARSFLNFCQSDAGQAIFQSAGFLPAPKP